MGHNVLMMDCDLVWVRDPRPLLLQLAHDSAYDILALDEGRSFGPAEKNDELRRTKPESPLVRGASQYQRRDETQHGRYQQFNTGFVLVRSTPMSKFFMASVVQALPLVLWQRSDQLIWNNLLYRQGPCVWNLPRGRAFVMRVGLWPLDLATLVAQQLTHPSLAHPPRSS